jgi:hypothetical protein
MTTIPSPSSEPTLTKGATREDTTTLIQLARLGATMVWDRVKPPERQSPLTLTTWRRVWRTSTRSAASAITWSMSL